METKKRMGRPRLAKRRDKQIIIRLDDELDEVLTRYAALTQIKKASLIWQLLKQAQPNLERIYDITEKHRHDIEAIKRETSHILGVEQARLEGF